MSHIPKGVGRVRFRAIFGFCARRSRDRTDVTIEFRTARRGVRIVSFLCAGRERFATVRPGVRPCAVPLKRNLARTASADASNCGKRNSRPRRGGGASERGFKRAGGFPVCFSCRLCFPPSCGVARRPFGNGFCGSAPNSARSAGRSVDLIFSPAPMRLQGFFFVSARSVGCGILMRALRFAQGSRIESDHLRAVRGVV